MLYLLTVVFLSAVSFGGVVTGHNETGTVLGISCAEPAAEVAIPLEIMRDKLNPALPYHPRLCIGRAIKI